MKQYVISTKMYGYGYILRLRKLKYKRKKFKRVVRSMYL